jgi:hypothetical protein
MRDIDELFESLEKEQANRRSPPVDQWHPDRSGSIDIRIARDGTWYHEGSAFQRDALVRLFASVLRKDPDGYHLVTPAERLRIEVEDAPFVAVDLDVRGKGTDAELLFTTNMDEYVVASGDHPIRVADADGEPRPYIMVRNGLEALIARPVFYRLVEHARQENDELVVYSRGARFPLGTL